MQAPCCTRRARPSLTCTPDALPRPSPAPLAWCGFLYSFIAATVAHLATRCVGVSMSVSPFEVGLSPSRKESRVPQLVPQHSNSRADLLLPLPSFGTNYPTKQKVGPSQPEVGPSHSHPSLSAYTRARGMDHSAPITLNANQGTRRAIKRCPPMRAVAKPSKPKLAPRSQKWPLGHRRGTMPRCATATVPTASHTSQAPISTTHDANSASAALHESPCAALRPRFSLLTYIM